MENIVVDLFVGKQKTALMIGKFVLKTNVLTVVNLKNVQIANSDNVDMKNPVEIVKKILIVIKKLGVV